MIRYFLAAALVLGGVFMQRGFEPAVAAQTAGVTAGSIAGTVVDQKTGLPIAHAAIALRRDAATVMTATTDVQGRYTLTNVAPGLYTVEIAAEGYGSSRSADVTVTPGQALRVDSAIATQATANGNLRTIGSVSSNSGSNGLQRSTVISSNVSADLIAAEGFSRAGDALVTLPGVNPSPSGVHGSTIGYSLPLDIRGVGSNESQVLIDGHPVGAFGSNAFPGNPGYNGAPSIYDFQNSPSDALRDIQVTYGSGAVGLYGVDSIGGIIDLQTIDPTKDPHGSVTQGFGSYGKSQTSVQTTGTFGKVGYALVSGVQGTYGEFNSTQIPQIGKIATDQTSANLAANTYSQSGDYLQRDTMGKLVYTFSPATRLTFTGYSSTSWSDKSGNGDNDFVTLPFQTLVANNLASLATAAQPSTITGANGATFNCVGSIAAINDAHPNGVCESAAQYAAATVGPQGGGPGPWQALRNTDYHARFNTQLGGNTVTLDAFVDEFGSIYSRSLAINPSTNNGFYGPSNENTFRTSGLLISDDFEIAKNDIGFGYYTQTQKITGSTNQPQADPATGNVVSYARAANPEVDQQTGNFFVRDAYSPTSTLGFFFNGWVKHNTVSESTAFDPRLSVVFKPTGRDVVRVTGGRSTDAPFIGLKTGRAVFDTATNNVQPACGAATTIGNATNPHITDVSGTDVELAYGHSFHDDTNVQLTAYHTNLSNPIFNSVFPALAYAGNATLQGVINALNGPGGRYITSCGVPVTIGGLQLSGPVNVAGGRFQGLDLSGRVRINRSLFVDYGYDIQSAAYTGVSTAILMANPFLIDGAQITGIPLHTGSLGIDFRDRQRGFEARLDANYVGPNNSYFIGPYAFFNGFIRQSIGRNATLTIGGINIFNEQALNYGYIGGAAVYQPENKFYHDPSFAAEAFNQGLPENVGEVFGLPPAQVTLSIGLRI